MIKKSLFYIKNITEKKHLFHLKLYFFGLIFISIIETIGIGIIPAFLAIALDKNLILEKVKFNPEVHAMLQNFLNIENLIIVMSILTFIFFLIRSLIFFIYFVFEAKLTQSLKISTSSNLFKLYLNKKYLYHANNNPIILGRNCSSEVNACVSYIKSFFILVKEILQIFLIAVLLMFANFKITVIIFFTLMLLGLLYLKLFSKSLRKKVKIAFYERGEKSKIINQILNAIIEVKLYQKEKFFINKFISSISREFQSLRFYEIISKIPKLVTEIFVVLVMCLTIIITFKFGINIEGIISILTLYFFAAIRIYPSISNILMHRMALINGSVSMDKISNEFMAAKDHEEYKKDENEILNFNDCIELKNISFNYPEREKIIQYVNLKILKNEIIGIVGKTGSGKSSLIKIIMGLIDPTIGKIKIDNNELHKIKESWQKKIGYIPQNFYILDDTIKENIIFGENKNEVNDKKIKEVIKIAALDSFIESLPKKMETTVGSNGRKLSGGQAQRLAIARALYQDVEVMVFDEATNSLDSTTEQEIIDYVYNLKNKKTVIIITHNEKILQRSDKIFKIESGNVKQLK